MSFSSFFRALRNAMSSHPGPTAPEPPAGKIAPAPSTSAQTTPTQSTAALTPMTAGRVLLIHGYSADWTAFVPWSKALGTAGIDAKVISIGNYITLNNEVTIKDLGEAFDRALRFTPWSDHPDPKDDTFTFDAIVHSTGMLVLRQWLTADPFLGAVDANGNPDPRSRILRLKHLVGLAPATFGSPQAKQGRSWLGALVKGSKQLGPDFLNAGNQVLAGLELGSSYTWDLACKDMIDHTLYDKGPNTPYVTVFIGNTPYTGLAALSNSPGCDGTVRWAGCALNTRKVSVDFRRLPLLKNAAGQPTRCNITPWAEGRLAVPMIAIDGKNHGTIVQFPDDTVCKLIVRFLHLTNAADYDAWEKDAQAFGAPSLAKMDQESAQASFGGKGWQQLVLHVVDDHGDGVPDYNLQLFIGDNLDQSDIRSDEQEAVPGLTTIPLIADTYSGDSSFRCFYIRLSDEMLNINTPGYPTKKMWLELIASSGSALIEYEAYTGDGSGPSQSLTVKHSEGQITGAPVKLDITHLAQGQDSASLLYPYTTTLLEVFVERDPLPLNAVSQLFTFK